MGSETTGQQTLRAENIDRFVKGFALKAFKLKPLCMIQKSNSWQESYYQESNSDLTGGTGSAVKGVPRLAQFPYGEPNWTKQSAYLEKYGMEGVVSWEDATLNNIDVIARTLLRIGRAVASAIDTQIEAVINANNGNTVTVAAGSEWDSATVANRNPIQDILNAKRELAIDNYDPDDGNSYLLVNPTDYANLLGNTKVVNNPSFKAADVVANGVVASICGCKIVVSNTISASKAYLIKGKEALTWKEAVPLKVITIEDPGVKYTIRSWEVGTCQVPNPNAICEIYNTKI